ncbi:hypothetical protein B7494_g2083 [Chlorociboria aeruginascens]|nr:hypothetical protein B7494_g2083 [Chlorociboria aeruginascens]
MKAHSTKDHFDEKEDLLPQTAQHEIESRQTPSKRPAKVYYICLLVIFGLYFLHIIQFVGLGARKDTQGGSKEQATEVDFDNIIPSEKLEWHPCYGGFKCARLTVAMDYHRPLKESGSNPKVHVALLLVEGKHTGTYEFSKSPLLLNPGGPGGAGVNFAMAFGPGLQKILGEDQDIIGFDPRGIGATTPRADCFAFPTGQQPFNPDNEDFAGGQFKRLLWHLSGKEIGLVNSTSGALLQMDARARSLAQLCKEKDAVYGKNSILRYVSTPNVARDMLSIIEAWDQWTGSLSGRCHDSSDAKNQGLELQKRQSEFIQGTLSLDLDTKGKLVYWGFSYGTLLGATFAAMFPDKVGRVVLDGVVDADHYVGPVWTESLLDTDKIIASFATYCAEAKENCQLYRNGDKPENISRRFQSVFDNLKVNPISIVDKPSMSPVTVSYSDIKMVLFSSLYSPIRMFPIIATLINMLSQGHPEILGPGAWPINRDSICSAPLRGRIYRGEEQLAIMCGDKRYPLNDTFLDLQDRFERIASTSSFADAWMTIMVGCEGWSIEQVDPPMRWDDHPTHKQKPINTSFPVLFVSNTADPVTPLYAGVKMARKFVDAGLIEQQSEGHCSVSAVSKCSIGKIAAYFKEGKVPPAPILGKEENRLKDGKWERCEADEWPWHPYVEKDFIAANGVEGKTYAKKMTAWKEMQQQFKDLEFWGIQDGPAHQLLRGL